MKKTYAVEGMTCSGCVRSIAAAVAGEIPSASVVADLERQTIAVSPSDDEKVERAVQAAGFVFKGLA